MACTEKTKRGSYTFVKKMDVLARTRKRAFKSAAYFPTSAAVENEPVDCLQARQLNRVAVLLRRPEKQKSQACVPELRGEHLSPPQPSFRGSWYVGKFSKGR